jgi:hypothetical protein
LTKCWSLDMVQRITSESIYIALIDNTIATADLTLL